MEDAQAEGLFDPQKGLPEPDKTGEGEALNASDDARPSAVEGDSPNEGSVEGPLAPQPLPGGVEGESASEMRPREHDSRKSDGVEEFKRMEENAEAGRE
jgi:hypothetical protein